MLKKILILILIIFSLSQTLSSQEITAILNKDSITIGEQIELSITVKIDNNDSIIFQELKNKISSNVEIITLLNDEKHTKTYIITSFEVGKNIIEPIKVIIGSNEYFTDELCFWVGEYINTNDIPVDTVYSEHAGILVMGYDRFDREIDGYIPDSVRNNISIDSLNVLRANIKQQLIPMLSGEITRRTGLLDEESLKKIIASPTSDIFIIDKNGILEQHKVTGSVDTIFVREFDEILPNQALFTIYRIKDIQENLYKTPYNFAEFYHNIKIFFTRFWWLIVSLMVLIAGITYVITFYKHRQKPIAIFKEKEIPAHEIAFQKLEKIRKEKIWTGGRFKEYYVQVSDTIREYIEKRFKINATDMTTSEILNAEIWYSVSIQEMETLRQILNISDMVKFAKYQPIENENLQILHNAFDFVEKTKPIENITKNENNVLKLDK